jgi:hypothetical protein
MHSVVTEVFEEEMMNQRSRSLGRVFITFVIGLAPLWAQAPQSRSIAITIDDLPAANETVITGFEITEMTGKL